MNSLFRKLIDPEVIHHVVSFITWFQQDEKMRKVTEMTGWLPFRGVESYLTEVGHDWELADKQYETFVDNEWRQIKSDMDTQLSTSDAEEETKATFREALEAHEHGLYRCVCRCLLPEIERSVRLKVNDLSRNFKFADSLESLVNQGDLADLFGGSPYGLALYPMLSEWLFASVNTPQERSNMAPYLNRHVAAHGLDVYNTKKRSFNALVLSLYTFMVLTHVTENGESDQ